MLSGWMGLAGSPNFLERAYSDLWFRLAEVRSEARHVVLVKLDEATLAQHAQDPLAFWSPHFAQATEVLQAAGARLVGIDFLFSTSPERWLRQLGERLETAHPGSGTHLLEQARSIDQKLRRQLATGQVILAASQLPAETLLPVNEFLLALPDFDIRAHVGAANLTPDPDGTWRRFSTTATGESDLQPGLPRLLSLSFLLALRASGQDPHGSDWQFGGRHFTEDSRLALAFSGPPDSLPSLSMARLLAPDALNDPAVQALRGKVVLIGATYGGVNDVHLTPYGRGFLGGPLMVGAEIQGQIVEALLDGSFLHELALEQAYAAFVLAGLAVSLAWVRLPLTWGALLLLGAWALLAGSGWLGFRSGHLLPVAAWQTGLLLSFACIYAWRFTHGERERNRLRRTFSRYVAPEVVEALVASPHPPQLGGQSMEITLLFSDIRNFTTLSERLKPEEVLEILNVYFEKACSIMVQKGGCIDKFIGDAIMVEFGAPLPSTDHADKALEAALLLRDAAQEFRTWMQQRFPGQDLPEFAIGIGVHTGHAVVGNVGSANRMEYTAIGDAVNLASRLEGMTKNLGCVILASHDCLQACSQRFRCGQHAEIHVKGRTAPVEVFEILDKETAS